MSGKAVSKRGVFTGEVVANEAICREHYLLRLGLAEFPPSEPGQFVQLQCRPVAEQSSAREVGWSAGRPPALTQPELAARQPLLRRPFSLAGRRDAEAGRVELDIIYRTIGIGTHWLAGVEPGRGLSVIGPLGNSFRLSKDRPLAALVGGGVGIPPMIYLAETLAAAGKETYAFCGAKAADLLSLSVQPGAEAARDGRPTDCVAEFAAFAVRTAVATDDGSLGFAGLVSDLFAKWLDGQSQPGGELVVYACGPEAMMRAVAEVCIAAGVECQLAMERHMACGMGTCQSCVVKVRDESPAGWSYKLCCTDGPVFDARDIVWDASRGDGESEEHGQLAGRRL